VKYYCSLVEPVEKTADNECKDMAALLWEVKDILASDMYPNEIYIIDENDKKMKVKRTVVVEYAT